MLELTHEERAVLAEIHRADRDRGGLYLDEVDAELRGIVARLVDLGLVEQKPDYVRISGRGVEVLRDDA